MLYIQSEVDLVDSALVNSAKPESITSLLFLKLLNFSHWRSFANLATMN